MDLKKSYKGFIIWMIGFCAATLGVCFLPIENHAVIARISLNICPLGIAALTIAIYKTESVYWYTGISFEEAQKAGSERRRSFAGKHLKIFGLFALCFVLFSIVAQILGIPVWIDIAVLLVGILAAGVSTIRVHL